MILLLHSQKLVFGSYPLLNMIEFSEHEVDIDEDNGEAQDEVIGVSPNCA